MMTLMSSWLVRDICRDHSIAITAEDIGYLVFITLHTNDAAQTIDRIINIFTAEQHQ